MALKVALAFALVSFCLAMPDSRPSHSYAAPDDSEDTHEELAAPEDSAEDYGPAKYDFSYAVKDDDSGYDFGLQESRDGDRTEGSYYVQLPDGRLQKVTYYVDGDSGYVAEVTYEGEAQFPEPESSEESSVEAAPSAPSSLYGTPN